LQKLKLTEKIQEFFNHSKNEINTVEINNQLLTFSGTLEEDQVYRIGEEMEKYLKDKHEHMPLVKKIFFTAVESLQNIRKHGLKDEDGSTPGAIIFYEDDKAYHTSFISAIDNTLVDPYYQGLDYVNNLDKDQLKQYYREVLDNGVMSAKGGAGLGLITIGLKCSGKIGIEKIPFGDDVSIIRVYYKMNKIL
jgi:hypothetical protein